MADDKIANAEAPKSTDDGNPTKVQDLAKAGRDDFDPNEGQE